MGAVAAILRKLNLRAPDSQTVGSSLQMKMPSNPFDDGRKYLDQVTRSSSI
jgi:hypothetical protein